MVWPFRGVNQAPGRRVLAGRRGRRRRLTIEALERRQLLAVDLSAYAVHRIVDNLSPAYTEAGSGWLGWSGSGAYQGDLRYVGAGTGQNTATFSLADLDPAKTYQLFATWNESGAHASNTPFTVLDGGVALATVQLSQQAAPSEATLDGQNWQSLGVFHASTGTLNVRISDAANGSVVADAVCIVQIAPLTLYWDADGTASNNLTGTGAGLGGSGTWAAGSGNCWYDPITGQDIPWVNGAQAVFTGSAGVVTISGAVSASKITVTSGNVVLQLGSISLPSSGGTTFEVANGTTTISSSLTGSGGLTTSGGGTLALSGVNTYTGLTTAGGGTLRFSGPASAAVGSIVVSGGDISIDNGVTLVSRTGNIQFSTNNSIKPTGTSGALGFPTLNSAYVVSVDSGITGTISAAITGTTTGNAIRQLGPGTLLLAGQNNLVTDTNSNLTAYLALDGGGTVNVTGRVKAASSLQSGRSNGTSTVGQTSGGNTLNISGVGQVIAGRLDVGGGNYGGNSVVISSPGSQVNPSYWMIGSGAQLNVGVSSSGNSVVVSNGAYLYQSNAGGTNAWTIGANAGANNNSLTVTGAGSTIDRTAAAGSPIVVGAAGSFNSLAVNDGGLLRPRRLIIGSGTAAGNGSNNTATVSGSGSSIVIANDSNGVFQLGSGAGSSGNSLTVSGGASISLVGANASRDFSIGSANLANNNYVRITGAGSSATITNQNAPLAIGGINHTGSIVDSTATGNHLDVHAGAALTANSLYLMGLGSAFNLGDGTSISTATVGNTAYNATTALVALAAASARVNMNGGRLVAAASNTLVGGPGSVQLNGPAYISTAGFNNSITSAISGTGSLTKEGTGVLTLAGANAYSGQTLVTAGTLNVTGSLANSAVVVSAAGNLAGSGTIATAVSVAAGGGLSPGDTATGIFNTGNLALATGARYVVQLNGDAAGTGYDQTSVTGTVALDGAELVLTGSRVVHDGTTIVILKNDGTDPVGGRFVGLAEGDAVAVNGVVYHITYSYNAETGQFGNGNDIALVDNISLSGLALSTSSHTIDENGSVTISGTFNDPGASGGHTVTIDWADGSPVTTVNLAAGVFAFADVSHTYLDNLASGAPYSIHVTVTDASQAGLSANAPLTVLNVRPTAVITSSGLARVHDAVSVSMTGSDASSVDTASLRYVFSTSQAVRDGAGYITAGTAASQSFSFAQPGTYTIYGRVLDKDGGYTDCQTDVTIDPPLTLYWDANGTAAGLGGSGIWDASAANWTTNPLGSSSTIPWVAGSYAVFQGTAGTVTVSGTMSFETLRFDTGGYLVQSGTLALPAYGDPATIAVTGPGNAATISSVLGGGSGLTKLGDGVLVLAAANGYGGSTVVSAGTLAISGGAAIPDTSPITVAADAVLHVASNETVRSLSGGGGVILAQGVLTVGANDASSAFSGTISGSGGLAKIGSGTLTLSGANTFTGGTTASSGTLSVNTLSDVPGQISALGTSGTITVSSATFQYTGSAAVSTSRYNGGGSGGGIVGTTVIDVSQATGSLTLVGGYNNYRQNLSKTGPGTLVLSGENVLGWGSAGVHGGTLVLAAKETNSALYTTISDISAVDVGATLRFAPYSDGVYYYQMNQNGDFNFTMTGGTLDLNGDSLGGQRISAPSGTGVITNSAMVPALLNVGVFANRTFSGTIQDGPGTVAVLVSAAPADPRAPVGKAWKLTGHNTYSGGTTIAGGAALKLGAADALPINGAFRLGDETLGSGILDLNGFNIALTGLYTAAEGATHSTYWDEITNSSDTPATLTITNTADYVYGGHFAGNLSVDKFGPGKFTASGGNLNSGDVSVYDGTLEVLGYFLNCPQVVPGFGNPHLLGKVDPQYFVVKSEAVHGEAALTLANYQFYDLDNQPATDLQGTSTVVLATDWRAAVYKAVKGQVLIKPTGKTLIFPTDGLEPNDPHNPDNVKGSDPNKIIGGFRVDTVRHLKIAIDGLDPATQQPNPATGKFDLYDKNPDGTFKYKDDGITSDDTKLIVMEDMTGNIRWNDVDYDDTFWVVTVVTVDIDTDSNNNGSVSPAEGPGTEDEQENDSGKPGKIVQQDGARAEVKLKIDLLGADSNDFYAYMYQSDGDGSIKVYDALTGGNEIALGSMLTLGSSDVTPSTVWVEGTDVGTANLSLILYSNSSDKFFEDTITFTIVNVDLDIDSNNDGTISPHNGSDTEDSIEDDANHLGKRIFVNNDDDNVNGVADAVDGHSAYDDVDDNDFAEIKLSYHGFTPANMSGYKLQLDWTNGLNLYAGKDKEALTQTEWTLGSAITLPSSIYAEGITTDRQTVSWRLVKTSTSEIVASDTVAINVEKIVWPFATQTYQQNWNERPTSDWVGLDVAEAWYMDKTLVDYVMTPGTKGHLETIHPNLDNPNAPGTQVTWASKEGGLSPTTDTYTNGFTMEFDYSFETSRFSPTGYIQASGKPAKLSFVGNSGVKFGTMTSGKLCEVNILDVKSMVAEGGGLNEFDPSQNGYVRSNGDVDTNDQYQTEALKTLVTGVIYNGDYDNMKDYQDVGPNDPPTAQDFYDTLVNNYNRTNGHIKIDVTLVSGSTYTVNVYLDNEQQTCYSDAITLTSLATLNLQSHWGSGVIFSNMDVTAKA